MSLLRQAVIGLFKQQQKTASVAYVRHIQKVPTMPENVNELNESQKSQLNVDRSRDISGQQTGRLFTGGFMNSQQQMEERGQDGGNGDQLQSHYETDGYAQLGLKTNVPEPYNAQEDETGCLKEGLPEGLSDGNRNQGQRFGMEERIDHSTNNA